MFISLYLVSAKEPVQINVNNISSINGSVVKMNNCDIFELEQESMHELNMSISPKSKGVKNNEPNKELLDLFNELNSLLKRDKTKFTLERERKLKDILNKHRISKEDLKKAATNIGNSEWMQGKNDRNTIYAKIDYLLRPDKAIEWAEREPEKKENVLMEEKIPHNQEAEAAVLGSILIDNSKLKKVREILTWEDFYDKYNAYIFRGVEWLDNKGSSVDFLTLTDALRDVGYLEAVGGSAYISTLTDSVPVASRVLDYAKIVADDAAKRRIKKASDEIGKAASNGSTLEETLEIVKQQIHDVNQIGGKANKYQVSSMLDHIAEAEERYKHRDQLQGLSTGFPSIDKLTMGLVAGELIVVAGPTSKGKTLLAMSISNNVAKRGGRVLFVTLEMTKAELTSRYMYVNGGADTADFNTVAANTVFQDNDELDWKDIDGLIQNAKEQLDVDLVVIDHLHYFARDIKNVAEELGKITMTFKKNAIRHKLPIILISHIRKLQKDEDLSGDVLRGSSLIAQDSDIVLLVNRDPETNQMGVLIDKNRNRGKLSDRTPDWGGKSQRDIDTIYLNFNNTKLQDTMPALEIQDIFPGSEVLTYKD